MGKLIGWIDDRFPLMKMWNEHLAEYYAPKNFNFWYYFGSLALLVLVIQIITGIFLAMHYKPDAELAFASVEYIMRDVPYGWLIRYMHSTGATAFFVVVYLHMLRGLMRRTPRQRHAGAAMPVVMHSQLLVEPLRSDDEARRPKRAQPYIDAFDKIALDPYRRQFVEHL